MPMWGYGFSWPMTFGVLCVMLILSGFAGLLIWAFARRAPEPLGDQDTPDALPMSILSERYARGELDTATFDVMRARLQAPNQLVERDAVLL